jgi:hypothetical protein
MSGSTPSSSGASSVLTHKGDIVGYDTARKRIGVGTNDQVLTADSTNANGLAWKDTVTPSVTNKILSDFSSTITDYINPVNDSITESVMPFASFSSTGSWFTAYSSTSHTNFLDSDITNFGYAQTYQRWTYTSGYLTFDLGYITKDDLFLNFSTLTGVNAIMPFARIETSLDNVTWTQVVDVENLNNDSTAINFTSSLGKNFRYFRYYHQSQVNNGSGDYFIGKVQFYYLSKDSTLGTSTNLVDDNTSTSLSDSGVNPNFTIFRGLEKNIGGLAIYPHSNTTETQIKIRVSNTSSFIDSQTVRTINTSNLTNGAWNYIRFNLNKGKYIQIYGSSGLSKVLEINEVKCLTPSDSEISQSHEHTEIDSTDTSLGLNGE